MTIDLSGFNCAKYCTLRVDKWKNKTVHCLDSPLVYGKMKQRAPVHKLSGRSIAPSQFYCRPLWKTLQTSLTPMCNLTARLVHLHFLIWKTGIKPRWVAPLIHVLHGVFSTLHDIFPPETPGLQVRMYDCLAPDTCLIAMQSCKFLLYRSFSFFHFSSLVTSVPLTPTVTVRPYLLLFHLRLSTPLCSTQDLKSINLCLSLTVILPKWYAELEYHSAKFIFTMSLPKYKTMLGHKTFSSVLHGTLSLFCALPFGL